MQNKDNQTDIFKFFKESVATWAQGQRMNFLKKAYRRNDGSYYDESLFGIWGLLIAMTAVTAAGGCYYHYNIFQTAFDLSFIAIIGSFLLFLLAEICLVWFGLNWLRGIYNGVWKQTFADFGIFLGMAIIVIVAAMWDYDINTRAVSTINATIRKMEIKEVPFSPPPSIAEYEEKIKAAREANALAMTSIYRGKPTGPGLEVQKANTQLIAQLEKQKSEALSFAKAEHDSLQMVQQLLVTGTAHQLADYGKYAVLAKILFILLIPLCEIKNFQVTELRESEEATTEDTSEKEAGRADTALMEEAKELEEIGFSAIASRLRKTPPPPPAEKRGRPEYTHFRTSARVAEKREEPKRIRIVEEVIEDVEKNVIELCGKIQKFYPSRWEKTQARGGKLSTMATNFHSFLQEIEELLQENPQTKLSGKWRKRVEEYQAIFQNQIKKHL